MRRKKSRKLRLALREALFGLGEAVREGIGVAEERIGNAAHAAKKAAEDCGGCGPGKRAATGGR